MLSDQTQPRPLATGGSYLRYSASRPLSLALCTSPRLLTQAAALRPHEMALTFAPLSGAHGFGAALCGPPLDPALLAALPDASRDALIAALDEHALLLLRLASPLPPKDLAAFTSRLLGPDACVNFSGTPADAAAATDEASTGGAPPMERRECHAPGVPEVRVLGNVKDGEGRPASLLCRIGCELPLCSPSLPYATEAQRPLSAHALCIHARLRMAYA